MRIYYSVRALNIQLFDCLNKTNERNGCDDHSYDNYNHDDDDDDDRKCVSRDH